MLRDAAARGKDRAHARSGTRAGFLCPEVAMDRHVIDYADARNMMVDGQVRPNKVYDGRVLDAMRRLP